MKAAEAEGARGNASERRRRVKVCWSTLTCAVLKVRGGGSEPSGENAERKRRERSKADEKRGRAPRRKVSGDDSWRAPPVPIPNTEVKPPNADGTELGTAWESRKLPGSKRSGRNESFSRSQNIRENGAARRQSNQRSRGRSQGRARASQKRRKQATGHRRQAASQTPNDPQ